MNKILLVEDDSNFGKVLKNYLEMNNYTVTWAVDGSEGLMLFSSDKFDLCILDVMMPVKDGFTLGKEIRNIDPDVPIVFLTAKTLKEDQLTAFKSGADDYITKPFDSELLLYKLEAILKRVVVSQTNNSISEFEIGKYVFNFDHRLVSSESKEHKLSPKEAELLKLLCIHKGGLLPRQKALISIWGDDNYFNGRSMDVFITKLRKYFKNDSNIELVNIHGKGYRLIIHEE
ncbi:MAG TPA: response regulator transcription factor [Bacteroidia bacterium]|nr:response regulator transcription factor [Bacteroidia bacterium]